MGKKHDGVYLDGDALDTLELVKQEGRASTRDVTTSESIAIDDNDRARYRLERLAAAGLVQLHDAETPEGGGRPPRVATLTDEGKHAFARGLLDDVRKPEADENIIDTDQLAERIDDVEQDVDELTEILAAFAAALDDEGIDLRDYLEDTN